MTDVVVVTDLATPYRQPVFAALAERVDLLVLYVGGRSFRDWQWWRCLDGHESRFLSMDLPSQPLEWAHAVRHLRRNLEKARPRVIIAGGWNLPTSWASFAYAHRHRVPFGFWAESTEADARRGQKSIEFAKRRFVRRAHGVIVPGTRSNEYAAGLGARRVVVAPNAVDNATFTAAAPAAPTSVGRVLYVGRLAPEKGLEVLASAMAELRQRRPCELVVVGDGGKREEFESQLRGAGVIATFCGVLTDPARIAAELSAADVLVLPSHSEPWGLVVNEAIAAGTPAVVSDAVGSGPDLVLPGLTGESFPRGDATALADALERTLRRGKNPTVVAACHAVAEAHSPERCAAGFVDFIAGAAPDLLAR